LNEQYVSALADLFLPQRCVGCDGLASGLPCRDCFEVLPRVGRPVCARCGMPTPVEAFVCDVCKGLDFGFESARVSLRYEGVGEEIVHALKYRGYAKVVERVQPGRALLARGVAAGLDTPAFDTLEAVRRIRDQVELTAAERRANVEEAYAIRGRVRGRALLVDDVCLHHRCDDELVHRNPPARRGTRGGVRGEPVQDGMRACQHFSSFQLTPARLVLGRRPRRERFDKRFVQQPGVTSRDLLLTN
jgi:competence protein ComFC